jgi:hypothetical protein
MRFDAFVIQKIWRKNSEFISSLFSAKVEIDFGIYFVSYTTVQSI